MKKKAQLEKMLKKLTIVGILSIAAIGLIRPNETQRDVEYRLELVGNNLTKKFF